VPPFDPTVAPSVTLQVSEPVRRVARPILASECLRDDLAPIEPFPRATRAAFAASSITLLVAAAMVAPSSVPRAAIFALAGGFAGAGALVRSYASRGKVALVAAVGCLAVPSFAAPAAIALATPLFLRASYRAHRATRVALGVGIALFAAAAAASYAGSFGTHVAAFVMAAVAATSLLGFMGEQTTAGCTAWGALASLSAAATVAASARLSLPVVGTALAALGATTAGSVAAYVVAATRIAPQERAKKPVSIPASNDA